MKHIDMHVHLYMEHTDDQISVYAAQKRDEGMLKVLLIGDSAFKHGNKAHTRLIHVCESNPGFFVPFARINLAEPEKVDVQALFDMGCVGLKFIGSHKNYDDECYFPIFAKAEELGMPILFHTGILAGSPTPELRGKRAISTARYRPEYLDTVGRAFPDLIIYGAHLGNPWYEAALEIMRYNRNIYWDICGTTLTKKMTPEWWARIQWEAESRKQFLYGTDEIAVLPEESEPSHYTTGIQTHIDFINSIGWTEEEKEGYFYKNALGILEKTYARQNREFSLI